MMVNKKQSSLTAAEIAYLQSQRMARIATVGANGQPHVVPVAFRYNPETETIDIGGHNGFAKRKKMARCEEQSESGCGDRRYRFCKSVEDTRH